jgi:glycerol kinase
LESNAYQTYDIVDAMQKDSGVKLESLKVDGGMVANDLLMQFQSDILNGPVIRPIITETTALGAAYAAGLAIGFWSDLEDLRNYWKTEKIWNPRMVEKDRKTHINRWKKAVKRTFDWVE